MLSFSVVIPHYCAPDALQLAVSSVAAQTLPPTEIIVVDDCSPDSGKPRDLHVDTGVPLKLLSTDSNFGGPAGPRNLGAKHASGDYIAFLDADDLWAPIHLETLARAIEEFGCALIGTTIRNFREHDELPQLEDREGHNIVGVREVLIKNPFGTSATAVEKQLFSSMRFNEQREFHAVEDGDLWQRIIIDGNLAVKLKAETVWYFLNSNGISADKGRHLKKVYRVLVKNGRLASPAAGEFAIYTISTLRFALYCVLSFYRRVVRGRL